jgi:hypothetical protein
MDMIAPLVKTGLISDVVNLWLAVPIGFIFGFALYHAGFTDSRRIARAFYLKDVGVPVVMFSAIITGMLGLWLLGLIGFLDIAKVSFLPTYLKPMAVGGVLFGIGMAIGGFCPGTAAASFATGRVDAMVFLVGFLGGSILFGDYYPIWGDFYNSDYRGTFQLDHLFGMSIGAVVLIMVIASVAGSLFMRFGQHYFWPKPDEETPDPVKILKIEAPLVMLALVVAAVMAFFPSDSFMRKVEPAWFILQREAPPASNALPAKTPQLEGQPKLEPVQKPAGGEGC